MYDLGNLQLLPYNLSTTENIVDIERAMFLWNNRKRLLAYGSTTSSNWCSCKNVESFIG
jgi:hypothetical protein